MRLAALAKAGFYATPPEALERIASMLVPEQFHNAAGDTAEIRVLDPCAGEGDAIARIAEQLQATPFTCELQRDRALVCKERFTYAHHGNAFRLHLTPKGWSLLYLNPPYDNAAAANNTYEAKFLSDLDRALCPGGLLIYVVPINRIPAAAAHISGHYTDVRLFKFTPDEYRDYEQVALFARKRGSWERNDDVAHYLEYLEKGLFILPELPAPGTMQITVPALPHQPLIFEPGEIDKDALAEALNSKNAAWRRPDLDERLWPSTIYRANPLMPLQRGHLALLLAAGYLDNCQIDSDEGPLIVKGQITKELVETENNPEEGRRKERERLLVSLNVFNSRTGSLQTYDTADLNTFVGRYKDALSAAVISRFPAQYNAGLRAKMPLDNLLRTPIGGQADAARATAWGLRKHKGTLLLGEMGCGKTYIAAAVQAIASSYLDLKLHRNIVFCPPHLTKKWAREVQTTIPGAKTLLISSAKRAGDARPLTQLEKAMATPRDPKHPLFIIISREQAKLSYRTKAAAINRRDPEYRYGKTLCCPDCFRPLVNAEGSPLLNSEVEGHRVHCLCTQCREAGHRMRDCQNCCGGATWSADNSTLRRYELARYLSKQHPIGAVDLFICDEAHEYKGEATAQGRAAAVLAQISKKAIALSGSIYTGMASDLFQLLYRFTPEFRDHFRYDEVSRFVEMYGIYEYAYTRVDADTQGSEDLTSKTGAVSRRGNERVRKTERPGMSPAILLHAIGQSVFIRLEDINKHLPPYHEHVHIVEPEPDLQKVYDGLAKQFADAKAGASFGYKIRVAGIALQQLLSYPDSPHLGLDQSVRCSNERWENIHAPAILPPDGLWAKERKLTEILERNHKAGYRTLVYYVNTTKRDLSPRLVRIAERANLRATVLRATVKPENREGWIDNRVKDGLDVLFTNPSLVETGLDLLDFPKIVWYQVCYRTITVRQASHRSWRIPQKFPVDVDHIVYAHTKQEPALMYVATKVHTSNLFEGDLEGDGLDDLAGDDALGALAKMLFDDRDGASQGLEQLFASLDTIKADQETYLDADYAITDTPLRVKTPDHEPAIPHEAYFGKTRRETLTDIVTEAEAIVEQITTTTALKAKIARDAEIARGQLAMF